MSTEGPNDQYRPQTAGVTEPVQSWSPVVTPGPSPSVQVTMNQMTDQLQTVIDAAERAATAIRQDAEEQARQHLADAQRKADRLTAERVRLIAQLTDDLLRHAGTVREQSEVMVDSLETAIRAVTKKLEEPPEAHLPAPPHAPQPAFAPEPGPVIEAMPPPTFEPHHDATTLPSQPLAHPEPPSPSRSPSLRCRWASPRTPCCRPPVSRSRAPTARRSRRCSATTTASRIRRRSSIGCWGRRGSGVPRGRGALAEARREGGRFRAEARGPVVQRGRFGPVYRPPPWGGRYLGPRHPSARRSQGTGSPVSRNPHCSLPSLPRLGGHPPRRRSPANDPPTSAASSRPSPWRRPGRRRDCRAGSRGCGRSAASGRASWCGSTSERPSPRKRNSACGARIGRCESRAAITIVSSMISRSTSDRAVLEVEEVVAELPGRAELRARVAAADLGPAGDARLDQQAPRVVREDALELGGDLRLLGPRADEGHVAAQDVDDLRQLVDVEAAQDAADRGHAIVVGARPLSGRRPPSSTLIVRSFRISNSRPRSPTRRWR